MEQWKECLDENGKVKIICGIYCIYNSKYFYVGQAIDINRRWNKHRRQLLNNSHENEIMQRVFNKYSESDPFKYKIIKVIDSDLNNWEYKAIISIAHKFPNLICMNIADPRKTYCGQKEIRERISLALTGKSLPELTKQKMSQARKGRKNPWKWVKVVQLDTNGKLIKIWDSRTHAEKELGFSIRIDNNRHGGFQWQHYEDWLINPKGNKILKHKVDNTIKQFSFNGNLIKEWNSIKEASIELNISSTQICECLNNKGNTAGGYLWSYTYECPKYIPQHNKKKIIEKYDLKGNLIEIFQSIASAARSIGSNPTTLRKRILDNKEIGGFIWKYQN